MVLGKDLQKCEGIKSISNLREEGGNIKGIYFISFRGGKKGTLLSFVKYLVPNSCNKALCLFCHVKILHVDKTDKKFKFANNINFKHKAYISMV